LFAVHPLQVDTVAWVTERKNLLVTLFWLLTTWAYVRYAEQPGWRRYLPVLALFALGLMCKPVLVTLPCVLLLLDFWPLRRWRLFPAGSPATPGPLPAAADAPVALRPVPFVRLLLEKLPLLALSVVSSLITVFAHHGLGIKDTVHGLPVSLRVENALVSYARYLGKVVWPEKLAVFYQHPGQWPGAIVGASLVLVLALTAFAVAQARRRPYLLVGWLWFLGVLVPTSGVVQAGMQAMADRFAYQPLIGLFLAAVWGVAGLSEKWPRRGLVLGLMTGLALSALGIVTSFQVRHWRNSLTLFEHALAVTGSNFVAHNNLSVEHTIQNRLDLALHHAVEAVRARPDIFEARLQLGLILVLQRKPEEAFEQYRVAVQLRPAALDRIRRLANELIASGKLAEATDQFTLLLRLAPGDVEAHAMLALLHSRQRQPAEAIRHYREALRAQPDSPELLNNLAWLLATQPDAPLRNGAEAVRLAERAVALTQRRQAVFVGTLAAAYAEAGRFADAVKTAEEAKALALAAGQKQLADLNQKLLDGYRAGKPHREEPK
jgi:Tfp pilus assembly protein PilF